MDKRAGFVLDRIWAAVGGDIDRRCAVKEAGAETLDSTLAVSDLAAGAVAAAAAATVEFARTSASSRPPNRSDVRTVLVNRWLVNRWFARSLRPLGWHLPEAWDSVAGDYPSADGWIKLHTNAPHHRVSALGVLGLDSAADRTAVAERVASWSTEELETAVVQAGGCAARMRTVAEWGRHPQGIAIAAEPLVHVTRSGLEGPHGLRPRSADRPLSGVRVLDLTRVLAGPVVTRWLAGLGAEVLRIDPPRWEEPAIVPEMTLGKRCARLDLRSAEGRSTLVGLLRSADVLVHGYRLGALDGLGLGEDERQSIRPGLVDISLNAYGFTGPWAHRRGFDSLVQMSSGINDLGRHVQGSDRPVPLPVQALDHATGYVLASAVLRGLTERQHDGRGWVGRASLARTAHLLMECSALEDSERGPGGDALDPDLVDGTKGSAEQTPWGPAQRLAPPVTMPGTSLRWESPATTLGSANAVWL